MIMRRGLCFMRLAMIMVAVPPQNKFFENEKNHDAKQHRRGHLVRFAMFERVRQNFQKSRTEQGAYRIGNEHIHALHPKGRADRCRCNNAQGATGQ